MTRLTKENIKTEFWRIFRFGITGTLSSLIHYGVYCVALMSLNPTLSYTAGYLVGLVCNYGLTTFFTFRQQPSKKNAAGFVASHALNYLLEIALLHLFLWIGAGELLAPALVMVVVVPINFLILHFVYLHKRKA
ncbi:MAG: GtrA family protein [Prevotella sp.]|nr:GtrA family protein [Prevotella sp.]